MDDGDACASLSGTAGAARTVGVVLNIVGQAVVDDMGEVLDIKTAGCHVGGHEQLGVVLAELLHGEVALGLREVAVQGFGIVAVANEVVGHLLCFETGAAEDDAVDAGIVIDHALEGGILVFGVDKVVDVVDVFGTFVARTYHNFFVVVEVAFGYALNFLAHGGRKEQGVALGGHTGQYFVDALGEAHVEHFVGLVEHHVLNGVETGHATVHEVDEAAGGGHYHLAPLRRERIWLSMLEPPYTASTCRLSM